MNHHLALAQLAAQRASLRVDTSELCCMAAMFLQSELGESTLIEAEALVDLFEATIDAFEPGAENPRSRATHAIERLRNQRLILRLDGAGVVRAGEYALSQLAVDIVRRFLHDERLTREHLDGLMNSVLSGLADARVAANAAKTDADWQSKVRLPLELVVTELLNGVERRQLGLDTQWRAVRAEITRLLEADWLDALGGIEALLDETAQTLGELKSLLLQHANRAHAVLDDIHEAAQDAEREKTLLAVRRTGDQIDRLLAWGQSRHIAWSDYHRSVHRFLRDVVRLDPDRMLSTRAREQLKIWPESPYYLRLAEAPRLLALRTVERRADLPPVERPHQDWTAELAAAENAEAIDFERLVSDALPGAPSLSSVVQKVLESVQGEGRYGAVGRIAAHVAQHARTGTRGDGPWIALDDGLQITEWQLDCATETGPEGSDD